MQNGQDKYPYSIEKALQVPDFQSQKPFQRLALLEATGHIRHFMPQELIAATNNFCLESMIEEGDNSTVYRAKLKDNQLAAVKVLKVTRWSLDVLFEVELLSNLKHNNIVAIKGYCYSNEVQAVVYSLLSGNLKQNLKQMKWSERMVVAIGVAKAIDYLHHCCEPLVIHNNVKSSNILLSDDLEPKVIFLVISNYAMMLILLSDTGHVTCSVALAFRF